MDTSIQDAALLSVGSLLQLAVFVLLIRRHVFSQLPVFVAYNGYSLVADLLGLALCRSTAETRACLWIAAAIFETTFNLLVLRELGTSVLRFNRIPAGSRWPVLFLFLINGVILWPAVQWQISLDIYPFIWHFFLRLLQVTTVLQAAAFGALVGWSSLNKLRWPIREFRIATGMGIWIIVSLAALMLHNDGFIGGARNHWVDQLTPAATLFVMAWWVHHFWLEPSQVEVAQESAVLELARGGSEDSGQ